MGITTVLILLAGSALAASPVPSGAQPAGETVTFKENVAPIFHESCTTCHRLGQVAPMSLLTYEDARPWVPQPPETFEPPLCQDGLMGRLVDQD